MSDAQTLKGEIVLVTGASAQTLSNGGMQSMPGSSLKGDKSRQSLGEEQRQTLLNSALFFAVKNGQGSQVNQLIKQGAEIDARDDSGSTPLYQAAAWGRLEAVDLLLKKGADAALSNREGVTPLKAAAANGHQAVIERLRAGSGGK